MYTDPLGGLDGSGERISSGGMTGEMRAVTAERRTAAQEVRSGRVRGPSVYRRMPLVILSDLAHAVHVIAVGKGWWGNTTVDSGSKMHRSDVDEYRKAWQGLKRDFGSVLALVHSEVSEVLEEYRANHGYNETYYKLVLKPEGERESVGEHEIRVGDEGQFQYQMYPYIEGGSWTDLSFSDSDLLGYYCEPCGIPTESADIIIRVLDYCAAYGIDIDRALQEKVEFNKTRAYKHGGKKKI